MKLKHLLPILMSAALFAVPTLASQKKTTAAPQTKTANVTGIVTADGRPFAGAVISDGHQITATDAEGRYSLRSDKHNGWIYISVPGGYEVPTVRSLPQFWASLDGDVDSIEQHDFTLTKVDNERHTLLAVTDMHLSNRYNDLEQFCSTFLPSVRETADASDSRVYTLNMGDMSFDIYWYSDRYAIENYRKTIEVINYPTPIFHCMGNHDNDGAVATGETTDFDAARRYCRAFGPNYYSFNIGRAHYIVLDNIVYLNDAGGKKAEGIAGKRNYERRVTAEQLEWLRKDLALVADKSAPVFVGMHAAAYHYDGITDNVISWFTKPEYSEELTACFEGFANVHYLTGHIHANNTTYINEHLTEHNLGAVCGFWWQPGSFFGQGLGPDGGPNGYGVFEVDGNDVKWHYHSTADGADKQFRTCDINEVREYYRDSAEIAEFLEHYPARVDFRNAEDNLVYINVWDWAPDWTLTVIENGRELEVVRERLEDPLLTISYDLPKVARAKGFPDGYGSRLLNHMFYVKASAPDSTLEVRVTDRFGRVYTETMERPKRFSLEMK